MASALSKIARARALILPNLRAHLAHREFGTRAALPAAHAPQPAFDRAAARRPPPPPRGLFTEADMAAPPAAAPLAGRPDAYDGLTLDDPAALPADPAAFAAALAASLPAWRAAGVKGVWLKLPPSHAGCVGAAIVAGFEFHHAEGAPDSYIMLAAWLPGGASPLPPGATHQVGVGAFVFDRAARAVLCVQEKNGPLRGLGVWKLPTGLSARGEDVLDAALREVEEETGVRCAPRAAVLAVRQAHGFAFGRSDLFFLLGIEAEGGAAGPAPRPQETEVDAAAWVLLDEFVAQPFFIERPTVAALNERCVAWAEGRYRGLGGRRLTSGKSGRRDLLLLGGGAEAPAGGEDDDWLGLV
jgi:8-oxo-dGTP pyrophosphatase MutT (NUDIX family)